jgi:hypothetical protein
MRRNQLTSEAAFSVSNGNVEQLESVTLEEIGFKERENLQQWIEAYPEIVGPDLLVITTELDRWEYGADRVRDRLDVLFLDSAGSLVVAELKRGEAPDTVDLQALKYAAYCSQLTVKDVVADYARYHKISETAARDAVVEHAPALESSGIAPVKVRLVAEAFRPSVTSMVLWLQEYELDIGCIEITARRLTDGNAVVTSRQILPLPVADDYLVQRRRKERAEERQEASRRRPNVVTELLAAGALEPGTELKLKVEQLTKEEQKLIAPGLQHNPLLGQAEWTGLGLRKALRWRRDNDLYSATKLLVKILQEVGARPEDDPGTAPGPSFWQVPDGRTLVEVADSLDGPDNNLGLDQIA